MTERGGRLAPLAGSLDPSAPRDGGPPTGRLIYVDNLRAACMLFGVFVHVTTIGSFGLLEVFAIASDWFRMATFFVLSGYLAAMLLERRTARAFLAHRFTALAVPLASSLLLLNPVTLYLVYLYFNRESFPGFGPLDVVAAQRGLIDGLRGDPPPWHLHLWFLFSLLAFVLAAPAVAWAIRSGAAARAARAWAQVPKRLWPLAVTLTIGIAVVAARVVEEVALQPAFGERWLIRATLIYAPYFALGMVMFHAPELWRLAHGFDLWSILAAAGVSGVGFLLGPTSGQVGEAVAIAGLAMGRTAVTFALLALARRFLAGGHPAARLLSSSMYTVYLFHYLLIYLLANLLTAPEAAGPVIFLVISFAVIGLGVALHAWCIDRVPWLTFLFNGRRRARSVA